MRGSTSRVYGLPFTLIWTLTAILFAVAIAGILSGIEMGSFDLFSAGAARSNLDGAFYQSDDELAFVVGGPAHVRLRIGAGTARSAGGPDRLVVQAFSAEAGSGF